MRRQVRSLPNDETAWQIYGLREDGVFVLFSYYYFISFFFFGFILLPATKLTALRESTPQESEGI